MFAAHVAEVVIASPDDNGRFHVAIGHALNWWNCASGKRHQIVLVPSSGQPSAAAEDLDHCDVFIATFDPMGPHAVETIGDVMRAKRAGKLALAWVTAESPSHSQRLTKEGVVPRYIGPGDPQFDSRLQSAISADLTYPNLAALTTRFDNTASARQVTIYRTPMPLLGPQIWAVTVANHSTSLALGLTVHVDAVDSDDNRLPDGATRSKQDLADVFAKLRAGRWPDEQRPLMNSDAAPPARGSSFLTNGMDVLAAHTALDFPRWLRPNQHASALHTVAPNASFRVRVQFEDEAGEVWSRTNDAEPKRISPSSVLRHVSTERT
jgi:hypothetical protein